MMKALGEFIVKRRWWVVGIWIVAAIIIVSLSPKLSTIESDDQSSFLPNTYESVKAGEVASKISDNVEAPTDIILFKSTTSALLSQQDQATIAAIVSDLNGKKIEHVVSVQTSPEQLSPNSKAQLATVTYTGNGQDKPSINAVKEVRAALDQETKNTAIKAGLTGQQAISYDTQDSADRALKIVSIATILLVLFLPAFIFRSPLAGLLPLVSVSIIYTISASLIAVAGQTFDFKVSQQLSILFTIVLYGIGTDYVLFLLFRYREKLRSGDHTKAAVGFALSRAGEAIFSAALVVLASFAALFFADFGIFSSLAPGLVICVAVMMLAALTLVPALLAIIGEKVFWPSKAWMVRSEKPTISKKIGHLIARRPGTVTTVVVAALVILMAFAFNFKADFSTFSQPPKGTQSANVYNELTQTFPSGALNPTPVYIKSSMPITPEQIAEVQKKLASTKGISEAYPSKISPDGKIAVVTIILSDDAYSTAAISNVKGPIRQAAHSFDSDTTKVYVGGISSAFSDIKDVSIRDLKVIFPIAAIFIFVILAVLLRSLVAPVFLLICVSLGYAATLGATTLIFQTLGGEAGLIFFIPLMMYIFVVAIGTDYNILTITRMREEIGEGNDPRKAAALTVEHSSATVVSAGLILAATFASLILGGLSFLTQMGTSIAIGVSLAAFVIAPFLIPSVAALLGYKIWWPHKPPTKKK